MITALRLQKLSLSKGYNLLIHNLNFELRAGCALTLRGENGIGKTTLLRAIAGFLPLQAGTIEFQSNDAPLEPDVAHAQHIHSLGHLEGLNLTRTVAEELRFQSDYLGGTSDGLDAAIDRLKLKNLTDLEARYLSAGQKRRLSLARLLSAPRSLWLLDEPMAPLDDGWRETVRELMDEHLKSGGLLIAAVHDDLGIRSETLILTRPEKRDRMAHV